MNDSYTIAAETVIFITERDFQQILDDIDTDEPPTDAALKAAAEYNKGRFIGEEYYWDEDVPE